MIRLLTILYIQISFAGWEPVNDTLSSNRLTEPDNQPVEITELIQDGVDSTLIPLYFTERNTHAYTHKAFADFYHNRDYQLAWHTTTQSLPQADSLLAALQRSSEEGLALNSLTDRLERLRRKAFKNNSQRNDLKRIAQLDLLMTSAYLTYASQLLSGRINPYAIDTTWRLGPRQQALGQRLEEALQANRIGESLADLIPNHEQYHQLKNALHKYVQLAEAGGWPHLTADSTLREGDTSQVVIQLRERLVFSGEASPDELQTAYPEVFDGPLTEALKRFQQRYGLEVNGELNRSTLRVLNVPVDQRIQQILINMERIRWWPDSLGDRYVMVNIPEYTLRAVENGRKALEMKVIVGEKYNSTPVFRDTIEYLELNPTWTVPLSIARAEILPILQDDPGYLARQNFKLYSNWNQYNTRELNPHKINWSAITPDKFNYRLVQQPGPKNPLGAIKFMFPNDLQVYMHDTPEDNLFERTRRTFSHGCIRVEHPLDLAVFLLNDPGEWSRTRLMRHMEEKKPIAIHLIEKVPVQFTYQTAFVDEEGKLNFREDIYRHDQEQINALQ